MKYCMCLFDEFFDRRAQARIRSDGGAFPERARAPAGPGPSCGARPAGLREGFASRPWYNTTWNRTHVKRALREQTLSSCGMFQLRAVLVREIWCERVPPRQRRRPETWPQHLCVRGARRRLGGARASERASGGASGGVDTCADRVASRGGVRAEGLDRARHSADRRARQRTGARARARARGHGCARARTAEWRWRAPNPSPSPSTCRPQAPRPRASSP